MKIQKVTNVMNEVPVLLVLEKLDDGFYGEVSTFSQLVGSYLVAHQSIKLDDGTVLQIESIEVKEYSYSLNLVTAYIKVELDDLGFTWCDCHC